MWMVSKLDSNGTYTFAVVSFGTIMAPPPVFDGPIIDLRLEQLQKATMIKRVFIAVAFVGLLSPICGASTIVFDNLSGAATAGGTPNDLSAILGGETVDDVTLATTTAVTGINWSGFYSPGIAGGDGIVSAADDDFEIRIYADNGGAPGALLQTFPVGSAVNRTLGITRPFVGDTIQSFDYSANIDFTFNAGVTHWLSVLNNTAGDTDDFSQSVILLGGNAYGDLNPNDGAFTFQGFELDFQLTTTAIPEPGSVGILALGLMGLLTRRKRS